MIEMDEEKFVWRYGFNDQKKKKIHFSNDEMNLLTKKITIDSDQNNLSKSSVFIFLKKNF